MTPITTGGYFAKGKSHTKSNVVKIGGGTAAGALIGGLVGGGKRPLELALSPGPVPEPE